MEFLGFEMAFSRLFRRKFKANSVTLLMHMKTKTNPCNAYYRQENHVDSDKMAKLSNQAKKPTKIATQTKNGDTGKDVRTVKSLEGAEEDEQNDAEENPTKEQNDEALMEMKMVNLPDNDENDVLAGN